MASSTGSLRVRLAGINAPEREECLHGEAAAHLAEAITGQDVVIEATGIDRFGRTLAMVWDGDSLVNLEMVDAGLALATTPDPGSQPGHALLEAEELAFSASAGMWSETACGEGPLPLIHLVDAASEFDSPGPDEASLADERVVFTTGDEADLTGWVLRDESSAHRCLLPPGTTIGPGQDLVVTSADPCWAPGGTPVWNNGGDMALLLDPGGRVVVRHRYGS